MLANSQFRMALRAGASRLLSRAGPLARSLSQDVSSTAARSVSTFSLPDLKYGYASLEPHFDEKTMTVCDRMTDCPCLNLSYDRERRNLTSRLEHLQFDFLSRL